DGLAADVSTRHRGQIHRHHVHRHTPQRLGSDTIDNDRRTIGCMTRIAIGIAASHDTDGHRLVSDESAAIADRVAFLYLLHSNDLAGKCHRWLQAEFLRGLASRRTAIQHDAGPYPVSRCYRMSKYRS